MDEFKQSFEFYGKFDWYPSCLYITCACLNMLASAPTSGDRPV